MSEKSIDKSLYENFNSDNILIRSVLAGLLDLLNHNIDYSQFWGDKIEEKVTLPWYYDFGTSQERFMQDNYTFFGTSCFNQDKITGTFLSLPNGIISYEGSNIEMSQITNRFVQGSYLKSENGKLVTYTSFLYSIPLTVNVKCTVTCDNQITAMKIEQALREKFYKNQTFYVLFRGMRIGCCVGFPENYAMEKGTEYSFDNSQKNPKITFSLVIETYQPAFDPTNEIEANKYIKGIGWDVQIKAGSDAKSVTFKDFDTDVIYPVGFPVCFEWTYKSMNSEMLNVGLYYKYNDDPNDTEEHDIVKSTPNQCSYVWNIPEGISDYVQPTITINDPMAQVIEEPVIRIIPNKRTHKIDENSFIVVDRGLILTTKHLLNFTLEYLDDDGNPHIASNYYFCMDNHKIADDNEQIHIEGEPIKYKKTIKPRNISVILKYTNDDKICDKIDNLLIL